MVLPSPDNVKATILTDGHIEQLSSGQQRLSLHRLNANVNIGDAKVVANGIFSDRNLSKLTITIIYNPGISDLIIFLFRCHDPQSGQRESPRDHTRWNSRHPRAMGSHLDCAHQRVLCQGSYREIPGSMRH